MQPCLRTYHPTGFGFQSHLLPMMHDRDRTLRMKRAIDAAVASFKAQEGRAPSVLDFSCGTGALSLLALKAGAKHVTCCDTNVDHLYVTKHLLVESGFSETEHFDLRTGLPVIDDEEPHEDIGRESFDMLVCEPFSTLTTSDGARDVWQYVEPYMRRTATGWFCIPSRASQTVSLVKLKDLHGTDEFAPARKVVFERLFRNTTGRDLQMFCTYETELLLADFEFERLTPPVVISEDVVGGDVFLHSTDTDNVQWTAVCDDETLMLFEWKIDLFKDIQIENSLDAYRDLNPLDRVHRARHWGLLATFVSDKTRSLDGWELTFSHNVNGVPKVLCKRLTTKRSS
tara:strand:- start:21 stop:1046 length:1026 start_codon:yes stop_codon:yes gene_type:complete